MFLLAQIADKLPTIPQMWLVWGLISVPFAVIAGLHRWVAVALLPVVVAFSIWCAWGAYQKAYGGGIFSDALWSEMGGTWVAHSFASPMLPAVLVLLVTVVKWRSGPRRVVQNSHPS